MRISVSPLIKHLCGKLILFSPTLKLVPPPIQFRIICLSQRCVMILVRQWQRTKFFFLKTFDKTTAITCSSLYPIIVIFFLKIKRNKQISFILNIVREKIFIFSKKNILIHYIYINFLFWLLFFFKLSFDFKWMKKYMLATPFQIF